VTVPGGPPAKPQYSIKFAVIGWTTITSMASTTLYGAAAANW